MASTLAWVDLNGGGVFEGLSLFLGESDNCQVVLYVVSKDGSLSLTPLPSALACSCSLA
jgi:hypothetical protein